MSRIYRIPTSFLLAVLLAAPNVALAQLSLDIREVAGAPAGYKTYDFSANVSTNMGVMELMLETYHPGDIYQNSLLDAPNVGSEAFDTYVTIGASGPNPGSTQILGGAVDLGGSATESFTNSGLDIAWMPTAGTMTGPGERQAARVTMHEKAQFTYTLIGWESGLNDDVSVTISGTVGSPLIISINEVGGAPAGYKTYDIVADVSTDMGVMELRLQTDHAGDIYQNSLLDDPDVGAEEFDTYVTIGASGPNPTQTQIFGGAVDLGGAATATFDTQNIDIAWVPTSGTDTGRGEFQVARITLADTASGSWTLGGWQPGLYYDVPLILTGIITGGEIMFLLGDANRDGTVSGGDFTTVQSYYGNIGAPGILGDANYDGTVSGGDFTTIQGYYGNGAPSEPAAIPEPATLGLLVMGGLALLRGKRRFEG